MTSKSPLPEKNNQNIAISEKAPMQSMKEPSQKGGYSAALLDPLGQVWQDWIEAERNANIFHHPAWLELLCSCYRYKPIGLVVYKSDGQIAAGIPLMEIQHLPGRRRLVALPFSDHCQPLGSDPTAQSLLLRELENLYCQKSVVRMEVRWRLPELPSGQFITRHMFHQIDLAADPSQVFDRFHTSTRRNIRIAERDGLRLEWGTTERHMTEFYRLQRMTRQRQGMPTQPFKFFNLMWKILMERDLGCIGLIFSGEKCIAGSIYLKWQKTLTQKYAASDPAYLKSRPNNKLLWETIRWGCENGYSVLDLGRTDLNNPGLRKFKLDWGARETQLYYTILASTPEQPGSGRLLHLMQYVIRHSPAWVSQLAGQFLYRYSG